MSGLATRSSPPPGAGVMTVAPSDEVFGTTCGDKTPAGSFAGGLKDEASKGTSTGAMETDTVCTGTAGAAGQSPSKHSLVSSSKFHDPQSVEEEGSAVSSSVDPDRQTLPFPPMRQIMDETKRRDLNVVLGSSSRPAVSASSRRSGRSARSHQTASSGPVSVKVGGVSLGDSMTRDDFTRHHAQPLKCNPVDGAPIVQVGHRASPLNNNSHQQLLQPVQSASAGTGGVDDPPSPNGAARAQPVPTEASGVNVSASSAKPRASSPADAEASSPVSSPDKDTSEHRRSVGARRRNGSHQPYAPLASSTVGEQSPETQSTTRPSPGGGAKGYQHDPYHTDDPTTTTTKELPEEPVDAVVSYLEEDHSSSRTQRRVLSSCAPAAQRQASTPGSLPEAGEEESIGEQDTTSEFPQLASSRNNRSSWTHDVLNGAMLPQVTVGVPPYRYPNAMHPMALVQRGAPGNADLPHRYPPQIALGSPVLQQAEAAQLSYAVAALPGAPLRQGHDVRAVEAGVWDFARRVLLPTQADLHRRTVMVQAVIKAYQDALSHVIPGPFDVKHVLFGSVQSRTCLPDGDNDVAVFVYVHDVPANRSLIAAGISGADLMAKARDFIGTVSNNEVAVDQLVFAEVRVMKLVYCGQSIDLTADQIGGFTAAAFVCEVDSRFSYQHIFRQTVVLVKAWALHEARILSGAGGYLNTFSVIVMLVAVFNWLYYTRGAKVFADLSPLRALRYFLQYYSAIDLHTHCMTIFGPIRASLDAVTKFVDAMHSVSSPSLHAGSTSADQSPVALAQSVGSSSDGLGSGLGSPNARGQFTPVEGTREAGGHPIVLVPFHSARVGQSVVDRSLSLYSSAATAAADAAGPTTAGGGARAATPSVSSTQSLPVHSTSLFPVRHLNVMDPLKPDNNLCRGVCLAHLHRTQAAFAEGAARVEQCLSASRGDTSEFLRRFLPGTLSSSLYVRPHDGRPEGCDNKCHSCQNPSVYCQDLGALAEIARECTTVPTEQSSATVRGYSQSSDEEGGPSPTLSLTPVERSTTSTFDDAMQPPNARNFTGSPAQRRGAKSSSATPNNTYTSGGRGSGGNRRQNRQSSATGSVSHDSTGGSEVASANSGFSGNGYRNASRNAPRGGGRGTAAYHSQHNVPSSMAGGNEDQRARSSDALNHHHHHHHHQFYAHNSPHHGYSAQGNAGHHYHMHHQHHYRPTSTQQQQQQQHDTREYASPSVGHRVPQSAHGGADTRSSGYPNGSSYAPTSVGSSWWNGAGGQPPGRPANYNGGASSGSNAAAPPARTTYSQAPPSAGGGRASPTSAPVKGHPMPPHPGGAWGFHVGYPSHHFPPGPLEAGVGFNTHTSSTRNTPTPPNGNPHHHHYHHHQHQHHQHQHQHHHQQHQPQQQQPNHQSASNRASDRLAVLRKNAERVPQQTTGSRQPGPPSSPHSVDPRSPVYEEYVRDYERRERSSGKPSPVTHNSPASLAGSGHADRYSGSMSSIDMPAHLQRPPHSAAREEAAVAAPYRPQPVPAATATTPRRGGAGPRGSRSQPATTSTSTGHAVAPPAAPEPAPKSVMMRGAKRTRPSREDTLPASEEGLSQAPLAAPVAKVTPHPSAARGASATPLGSTGQAPPPSEGGDPPKNTYVPPHRRSAATVT